MAEEKRSLLTKALLWMQEMEEAIVPEGLTLQFNGGEYTFFPEFVDRNDKKLARLLTGWAFFISCDNSTCRLNQF